MKQGIFSFFFLGTVCSDPETKVTSGGKSFIDVNCVSNFSQKKGDQWVDVPVFVHLKWWGDAVTHIERLLTKGTNFGVQGRVSAYKNKDNQQVFDFIPDGFPSVAHWGEDRREGSQSNQPRSNGGNGGGQRNGGQRPQANARPRPAPQQRDLPPPDDGDVPEAYMPPDDDNLPF